MKKDLNINKLLINLILIISVDFSFYFQNLSHDHPESMSYFASVIVSVVVVTTAVLSSQFDCFKDLGPFTTR